MAINKNVTKTDTSTTLPVTIIGDGTPITSYTVKGNMEQNGTPTPSSPIYPSECGERTENLFDPEHYITIGNVDYIGDVYPANKYRINNMSNFPCYYKIGESGTTGTINPPNNIYVNANDIVYVWCSVNSNKKISLTEGTTLKEYIPYGYKLPITLGSTTTDIYLGEVQSTRRVKKLVLTGKEVWTVYLTSYYITVNNYYRAYDVGSHLSACSHYPNAQTTSLPGTHYGLGGLIDGEKYTRWNGNVVFNPSPIISSKTDWISYLAAQYAAGTPVTVWYVLDEPETAVVNEPIRKIGDYVDSVSGTGLATSGAGQELNIETTLKPSEVDMTYHGWHEHDDTKYST